MKLAGIELVSLPRGHSNDLNIVRNQLLDNLHRQVEAATLMVRGKPSNLSDREKWYFKADGIMYFEIRVKGRRVVLGKEGSSIYNSFFVGDDKNAPKLIETVIDAVEDGQLDEIIGNTINSHK